MTVIAIVGPTGVGKTKLSIELAKKLDGEIINADSTQVYKYLNIATAKVTSEEKEGVVHHLIDIKELDEDYSVFDYQMDVRNLIEDINARGKTPILVGGTGHYIKAALYDYNFGENEDYDYSEYSNDEIFDMLIKVDPNTEIHKNNRKRVEKAYNYFVVNNQPYSSKSKDKKMLYDCLFIGLTTSREYLYENINKRVNKMIDLGLLDEARKIYETKIRSKAVMTPIGYKELFLYFDNEISLEDAISLIQKRSRKYAKRQYTYFNNQLDINWFEVNYNDFSKTIFEINKFIKTRI